jgi:glycosidase
MAILRTDYEPSDYFPFGFHLSLETWERFALREMLTSERPGDAGTDIRVIRKFVHRVNQERDGASPDTQHITAGQVLTLGLLTEIFRFIIDFYWWEQVPGILPGGIDRVRAEHGDDTVNFPPKAFVHFFPPSSIQVGGETDAAFLAASKGSRDNHTATVREMILLWLSTSNRALRPFRPLFRDHEFARVVPYKKLMGALDNYFASQAAVDGLDDTLLECIRAPLRAAPDSLDDQLDFVRTRWGHLLPKALLNRLLLIQGIVREETMQRGFVQGTSEVMRFGRHSGRDEGYPEPERFSRDADWMSNVVLIAKTVYVWLDQLSKRYQRDIYRLDHIPDEELDRLARWGFNGLWLIGVWERSPSSSDIKRIMGNPEAVSSAYSLFDYDIAKDLGGEDAYENLRERANKRGIRLASDMVPNHMGIYSRWVVEHPNWFLSLDHPPYPAYNFSGKNLSYDERVGIFIEDGYWNHSDAAVVFKRVDHWTGDTKYIYHGNDGTSMPWNDTAQLNYLMPEVREAVIQTILHVARKFSIIRFDAAMTLAKKHFQRLWFPKPGDAGAIPSRAEHGMSREEFDLHIPEEFWREVVDRVAHEVPDTLLLAEAFWLMEGYFVRTLGMHRVYNSAFMNMLKMEDNADYRSTVKNVLEFSPEILKRFVNFMNNPDERTAVEQFGKGDKYFGVALLMVTMPGLPMFGHGQIEGFTEKYGMEYRKAYWDEQVDEDMIRRHEREIFPLMRRRYVFSGVENFAFYDFHTPQGYVDENVFAYSNCAGDQRGIVFYNNAYNTTEGWIRVSTALNSGRGEEGTLVYKSLADSLALRGDDAVYYVFRDHRDNLQYIRSGRQLCDEGVFVRLHAYQYHVFLDFEEVYDIDGTWGEIARRLNGGGVHNIHIERRRLELAPLLSAFQGYVNAESIQLDGSSAAATTEAWETQQQALASFLHELSPLTGAPLDAAAIGESVRIAVNDVCHFEERLDSAPVLPEAATYLLGRQSVSENEATRFWRVPMAFALLEPVNAAIGAHPDESWLEAWLLDLEIESIFHTMDGDGWRAWQDLRLLNVALAMSPVDGSQRGRLSLHELFSLRPTRELLQINEYDGVEYFNREQFESMIGRLSLLHAITTLGDTTLQPPERASAVQHRLQWALTVQQEAENAGYRVSTLLEWEQGKQSPPKTPKAKPKNAAKPRAKKHKS